MFIDWLGIPAAILAWVFALYVYIVAPPTRGARFLVGMLLVDKERVRIGLVPES